MRVPSIRAVQRRGREQLLAALECGSEHARSSRMPKQLTPEAEAVANRMRFAGMYPRPILDRILVLQVPPSRTFDRGGLIVKPDSSVVDAKEVGRCEVLAVGPDVRDVEPGDQCIFRRHGGTALMPDDREERLYEASRDGEKHPWSNVLVLREKRTVQIMGKSVVQSDVIGVVS